MSHPTLPHITAQTIFTGDFPSVTVVPGGQDQVVINDSSHYPNGTICTFSVETKPGTALQIKLVPKTILGAGDASTYTTTQIVSFPTNDTSVSISAPDAMAESSTIPLSLVRTSVGATDSEYSLKWNVPQSGAFEKFGLFQINLTAVVEAPVANNAILLAGYVGVVPSVAAFGVTIGAQDITILRAHSTPVPQSQNITVSAAGFSTSINDKLKNSVRFSHHEAFTAVQASEPIFSLELRESNYLDAAAGTRAGKGAFAVSTDTLTATPTSVTVTTKPTTTIVVAARYVFNAANLSTSQNSKIERLAGATITGAAAGAYVAHAKIVGSDLIVVTKHEGGAAWTGGDKTFVLSPFHAQPDYDNGPILKTFSYLPDAESYEANSNLLNMVLQHRVNVVSSVQQENVTKPSGEIKVYPPARIDFPPSVGAASTANSSNLLILYTKNLIATATTMQTGILGQTHTTTIVLPRTEADLNHLVDQYPSPTLVDIVSMTGGNTTGKLSAAFDGGGLKLTLADLTVSDLHTKNYAIMGRRSTLEKSAYNNLDARYPKLKSADHPNCNMGVYLNTNDAGSGGTLTVGGTSSDDNVIQVATVKGCRTDDVVVTVDGVMAFTKTGGRTENTLTLSNTDLVSGWLANGKELTQPGNAGASASIESVQDNGDGTTTVTLNDDYEGNFDTTNGIRSAGLLGKPETIDVELTNQFTPTVGLSFDDGNGATGTISGVSGNTITVKDLTDRLAIGNNPKIDGYSLDLHTIQYHANSTDAAPVAGQSIAQASAGVELGKICKVVSATAIDNGGTNHTVEVQVKTFHGSATAFDTTNAPAGRLTINGTPISTDQYLTLSAATTDNSIVKAALLDTASLLTGTLTTSTKTGTLRGAIVDFTIQSTAFAETINAGTAVTQATTGATGELYYGISDGDQTTFSVSVTSTDAFDTTNDITIGGTTIINGAQLLDTDTTVHVESDDNFAVADAITSVESITEIQVDIGDYINLPAQGTTPSAGLGDVIAAEGQKLFLRSGTEALASGTAIISGIDSVTKLTFADATGIAASGTVTQGSASGTVSGKVGNDVYVKNATGTFTNSAEAVFTAGSNTTVLTLSAADMTTVNPTTGDTITQDTTGATGTVHSLTDTSGYTNQIVLTGVNGTFNATNSIAGTVPTAVAAGPGIYTPTAAVVQAPKVKAGTLATHQLTVALVQTDGGYPHTATIASGPATTNAVTAAETTITSISPTVAPFTILPVDGNNNDVNGTYPGADRTTNEEPLRFSLAYGSTTEQIAAVRFRATVTVGGDLAESFAVNLETLNLPTFYPTKYLKSDGTFANASVDASGNVVSGGTTLAADDAVMSATKWVVYRDNSLWGTSIPTNGLVQLDTRYGGAQSLYLPTLESKCLWYESNTDTTFTFKLKASDYDLETQSGITQAVSDDIAKLFPADATFKVGSSTEFTVTTAVVTAGKLEITTDENLSGTYTGRLQESASSTSFQPRFALENSNNQIVAKSDAGPYIVRPVASAWVGSDSYTEKVFLVYRDGVDAKSYVVDDYTVGLQVINDDDTSGNAYNIQSNTANVEMFREDIVNSTSPIPIIYASATKGISAYQLSLSVVSATWSVDGGDVKDTMITSQSSNTQPAQFNTTTASDGIVQTASISIQNDASFPDTSNLEETITITYQPKQLINAGEGWTVEGGGNQDIGGQLQATVTIRATVSPEALPQLPDVHVWDTIDTMQILSTVNYTHAFNIVLVETTRDGANDSGGVGSAMILNIIDGTTKTLELKNNAAWTNVDSALPANDENVRTVKYTITKDDADFYENGAARMITGVEPITGGVAYYMNTAFGLTQDSTVTGTLQYDTTATTYTLTVKDGYLFQATGTTPSIAAATMQAGKHVAGSHFTFVSGAVPRTFANSTKTVDVHVYRSAQFELADKITPGQKTTSAATKPKRVIHKSITTATDLQLTYAQTMSAAPAFGNANGIEYASPNITMNPGNLTTGTRDAVVNYASAVRTVSVTNTNAAATAYTGTIMGLTPGGTDERTTCMREFEVQLIPDPSLAASGTNDIHAFENQFQVGAACGSYTGNYYHTTLDTNEVATTGAGTVALSTPLTMGTAADMIPVTDPADFPPGARATAAITINTPGQQGELYQITIAGQDCDYTPTSNDASATDTAIALEAKITAKINDGSLAGYAVGRATTVITITGPASGSQFTYNVNVGMAGTPNPYTLKRYQDATTETYTEADRAKAVWFDNVTMRSHTTSINGFGADDPHQSDKIVNHALLAHVNKLINQIDPGQAIRRHSWDKYSSNHPFHLAGVSGFAQNTPFTDWTGNPGQYNANYPKGVYLIKETTYPAGDPSNDWKIHYNLGNQTRAIAQFTVESPAVSSNTYTIYLHDDVYSTVTISLTAYTPGDYDTASKFAAVIRAALINDVSNKYNIEGAGAVVFLERKDPGNFSIGCSADLATATTVTNGTLTHTSNGGNYILEAANGYMMFKWRSQQDGGIDQASPTKDEIYALEHSTTPHVDPWFAGSDGISSLATTDPITTTNGTVATTQQWSVTHTDKPSGGALAAIGDSRLVSTKSATLTMSVTKHPDPSVAQTGAGHTSGTSNATLNETTTTLADKMTFQFTPYTGTGFGVTDTANYEAKYVVNYANDHAIYTNAGSATPRVAVDLASGTAGFDAVKENNSTYRLGIAGDATIPGDLANSEDHLKISFAFASDNLSGVGEHTFSLGGGAKLSTTVHPSVRFNHRGTGANAGTRQSADQIADKPWLYYHKSSLSGNADFADFELANTGSTIAVTEGTGTLGVNVSSTYPPPPPRNEFWTGGILNQTGDSATVNPNIVLSVKTQAQNADLDFGGSNDWTGGFLVSRTYMYNAGTWTQIDAGNYQNNTDYRGGTMNTSGSWISEWNYKDVTDKTQAYPLKMTQDYGKADGTQISSTYYWDPATQSFGYDDPTALPNSTKALKTNGNALPAGTRSTDVIVTASMNAYDGPNGLAQDMDGIQLTVQDDPAIEVFNRRKGEYRGNCTQDGSLASNTIHTLRDGLDQTGAVHPIGEYAATKFDVGAADGTSSDVVIRFSNTNCFKGVGHPDFSDAWGIAPSEATKDTQHFRSTGDNQVGFYSKSGGAGAISATGSHNTIHTGGVAGVAFLDSATSSIKKLARDVGTNALVLASDGETLVDMDAKGDAAFIVQGGVRKTGAEKDGALDQTDGTFTVEAEGAGGYTLTEAAGMLGTIDYSADATLIVPPQLAYKSGSNTTGTTGIDAGTNEFTLTYTQQGSKLLSDGALSSSAETTTLQIEILKDLKETIHVADQASSSSQTPGDTTDHFVMDGDELKDNTTRDYFYSQKLFDGATPRLLCTYFNENSNLASSTGTRTVGGYRNLKNVALNSGDDRFALQTYTMGTQAGCIRAFGASLKDAGANTWFKAGTDGYEKTQFDLSFTLTPNGYSRATTPLVLRVGKSDADGAIHLHKGVLSETVTGTQAAAQNDIGHADSKVLTYDEVETKWQTVSADSTTTAQTLADADLSKEWKSNTDGFSAFMTYADATLAVYDGSNTSGIVNAIEIRKTSKITHSNSTIASSATWTDKTDLSDGGSTVNAKVYASSTKVSNMTAPNWTGDRTMGISFATTGGAFNLPFVSTSSTNFNPKTGDAQDGNHTSNTVTFADTGYKTDISIQMTNGKKFSVSPKPSFQRATSLPAGQEATIKRIKLDEAITTSTETLETFSNCVGNMTVVHTDMRDLRDPTDGTKQLTDMEHRITVVGDGNSGDDGISRYNGDNNAAIRKFTLNRTNTGATLALTTTGADSFYFPLYSAKLTVGSIAGIQVGDEVKQTNGGVHSYGKVMNIDSAGRVTVRYAGWSGTGITRGFTQPTAANPIAPNKFQISTTNDVTFSRTGTTHTTKITAILDLGVSATGRRLTTMTAYGGRDGSDKSYAIYSDEQLKTDLTIASVNDSMTITEIGTTSGYTHSILGQVQNYEEHALQSTELTSIPKYTSNREYTFTVNGDLLLGGLKLASLIASLNTGPTDATSDASFSGLATTSSGDGTGAIVTVVTNGSGQVSGATVTTAGSGYKSGDTLTVSKTLITGSGVNSNASADIVFTLGSADLQPEFKYKGQMEVGKGFISRKNTDEEIVFLWRITKYTGAVITATFIGGDDHAGKQLAPSDLKLENAVAHGMNKRGTIPLHDGYYFMSMEPVDAAQRTALPVGPYHRNVTIGNVSLTDASTGMIIDLTTASNSVLDDIAASTGTAGADIFPDVYLVRRTAALPTYTMAFNNVTKKLTLTGASTTMGNTSCVSGHKYFVAPMDKSAYIGYYTYSTGGVFTWEDHRTTPQAYTEDGTKKTAVMILPGNALNNATTFTTDDNMKEGTDKVTQIIRDTTARPIASTFRLRDLPTRITQRDVLVVVLRKAAPSTYDDLLDDDRVQCKQLTSGDDLVRWGTNESTETVEYKQISDAYRGSNVLPGDDAFFAGNQLKKIHFLSSDDTRGHSLHYQRMKPADKIVDAGNNNIDYFVENSLSFAPPGENKECVIVFDA